MYQNKILNYMIEKVVLLVICSVVSGPVWAQVGINTNTPDASSNLHVEASETTNHKGLLLGRMTSIERDLITQPAKGLMIYNTQVKCLQINFGDEVNPKWQCVNTVSDTGTYKDMVVGRYKPIHPQLPGASTISGPPSYNNTTTMLYGNIPQNGTFSHNDIIRLDVGQKDAITYSLVLYNISNETLTFAINTNAYLEPKLGSVSLDPSKGTFVDGDTRTYYNESQNIYVQVTGPTTSSHYGRKFLVGVNVFKEDFASVTINYGSGTGKENQSMLTYIFELKN